MVLAGIGGDRFQNIRQFVRHIPISRWSVISQPEQIFHIACGAGDGGAGNAPVVPTQCVC